MKRSEQLDRRRFLQLAGLVAAGAGLSACSPLYRQLSGVPNSTSRWARISPDDFRLLNRVAYGPSKHDRLALSESGVLGWVEAQLAPQTLHDTAVDWRLRQLQLLGGEANALADQEKPEVVRQLQAGALLRQIYSRRQLHERMVEFWTDHFNISVHKGDCWFLKVVDDREVIRAHALGSFRDLLWASAHSPAMLVYLDNQANLRQAPNENYARELLELHTLGVRGGYTQTDVMELARCLTGWSVKQHFWRGDFHFDPAVHDPGVKRVLGTRVEPAGQAEAESVLELLATHPSTARRIAAKLTRRFVTHDQSAETESLIERATRRFLDTSGSIRATLQVVLEGGLLSRASLWSPTFKRPLDFVVSSLRALNADTDAGEALQDRLRQMGQAGFEWPTPDGPTEQSSFWWTNLLPRWQFALDLSIGELPGTSIDLDSLNRGDGQADPDEAINGADSPREVQAVNNLAEILLGLPLDATPLDQLLLALKQEGAPPGEALYRVVVAGLLASPTFQWR